MTPVEVSVETFSSLSLDTPAGGPLADAPPLLPLSSSAAGVLQVAGEIDALL